MVEGIWVVEPLPDPFFLFFLLLSFCSSSPMSSQIVQVGVGGFSHSTSIPFFSFALLTSLFLALTRTDQAYNK